MSKSNQKIVLFIDSAARACYTPSKIGNLFMNRFAIDEAATHEILKLYHLENTVQSNFREYTLEEGMDLMDNGIIVHDS